MNEVLDFNILDQQTMGKKDKSTKFHALED